MTLPDDDHSIASIPSIHTSSVIITSHTIKVYSGPKHSRIGRYTVQIFKDGLLESHSEIESSLDKGTRDSTSPLLSINQHISSTALSKVTVLDDVLIPDTARAIYIHIRKPRQRN